MKLLLRRKIHFSLQFYKGTLGNYEGATVYLQSLTLLTSSVTKTENYLVISVLYQADK